jgi:L-gulonate 5-dehydrogenase
LSIPRPRRWNTATNPTRSGAGQCLIRIDSVGICGSDMHAYLGHDERRPAPLILGHEAAGSVVDGPLDGSA